MFETVGEINNQPDDQPDDKSYPGDAGESRHQKYTASNTQKWKDRVKRDFKGALPRWLFDTQDYNAEADQDKGKESADIGQVHHLIYIREGGDRSNNYAHDNRCNMRRFEFFMDAGENLREKPIAGHGKEDPGLSEYQDQKYCDVSHDRTEGHDNRSPGEIDMLHG